MIAISTETPPMSHKRFRHSILSNARVWDFLKQVDAAEAELCREAGCPRCASALHSATYPRKPHGLAAGLRDDVRRFSLCCSVCRRRIGRYRPSDRGARKPSRIPTGGCAGSSGTSLRGWRRSARRTGRKPLYLLDGLGGATKAFIESQRFAGKYRSDRYWESENGLDRDAKEELFDTVDVEYGLRLIAAGISDCVRVDRSG